MDQEQIRLSVAHICGHKHDIVQNCPIPWKNREAAKRSSLYAIEGLLLEHLRKIGMEHTVGQTSHMLAEWLVVNGISAEFPLSVSLFRLPAADHA